MKTVMLILGTSVVLLVVAGLGTLALLSHYWSKLPDDQDEDIFC